MIIVKLKGGLGNQMFQYSFARILGLKNDCPVLVDKEFFNTNIKGVTPRNFELGIFKNAYCEPDASNLIKFNQLSYFDKIRKKLGFNYPKFYYEKSFAFDENLLKSRAPVYLQGYFQSYKYSRGYEKFIEEIFSFPLENLDKKNKQIMTVIKKSSSVSIHIRRGDYVNDANTQKFHGNCSLEYYKKAISFILEEKEINHLFFFSDDIDWVRNHFVNLPFPKSFIDNAQIEDSWKDMLLMSCCKHNIIANSSFSWWAAWLNNNPNKIIIAPEHWFADAKQEQQTADLIPPEWVRL